MDDTLGLLEEAVQLARDLGYEVREEPLGELRGGPCAVGGRRMLLLNLEQAATERLAVLVGCLAEDPGIEKQPLSRLLAARLTTARPGSP